MSNNLTIINAQETIFFSHFQDVLRQWIQVTILNPQEAGLQAALKISAGGEEVKTTLEVSPGQHTYRGYAPVLWPHKPAELHASVELAAGPHVERSTVSVGTHRPWVIYLLADVCTDATWVYGNYNDVRKDDADLTYAELLLSEATRSGAPENHNHYNLVNALELQYFEEFYPAQKPRLVEAFRRGEITLNPFLNMTLTQNVSLEEQIRHFYPARAWAVEYGLEMAYANHQETPSIAWDMAGILAGCGVRHLIKAILPYECPWAARLAEPPLFLWEGPDGTQILYRRRNWDYVEGNIVLKGLEATDAALHEKIIPEYEQMGERYPFDAISLLGCYGDLIPYQHGKVQSNDLPLLKAATIAGYNAREWEYPRLVNASHKQYWDSIDQQIAARSIKLEVSRGDYGTGWDAWPACLAAVVADWRRNQERAGTADKLASVLSQLDPDWMQLYRKDLQEGWCNLSMLADHAWNGANDANRSLNTALRRDWVASATRSFDRVIDNGLVRLGELIQSSGQDRRLAVFNGLPWARDGVVILEDAGAGPEVIDVESGKTLVSQPFTENDTRRLAVKIDSLPSVGYRVLELRGRSAQPNPISPTRVNGNRLEGPFYSVEVDPANGGISSLFDKLRGKELVDPASPYHINQCVHFSDGMLEPGAAFQLLHPPKVSGGKDYASSVVSITPGSAGPVFASLVVRTQNGNMRIKTTLTLYAELDRLDIHDEVDKPPTSERQELDFYFPFNVPNRTYHVETPGAIIEPGKDHLPGAGLNHAVTRHFVDVSNEEYGVTLAQADSFVIEFGHRSTTEDPQSIDPANSTILVHALGNIFDSNEAMRDQGGDSHFVFRFSLQGHAGGFDPLAAVHFAWEDNNELLTTAVKGGPGGVLPAGACSFISVTPANAVLTTLKPAEEQGLIARLWECAGSPAPVQVQAAGILALKGAVQTDHLERDGSPLPIQGDCIPVPVKPRGVTTLRMVS
jgi:alpha-mannosidase